MTIAIPITAVLLVLIAAALGAFARWLAARLGALPWLCDFVMLFVFGLILLFGKVT